MLSFFIPALNNLAIRIKKGFVLVFFKIMVSCVSDVASHWLEGSLTFREEALHTMNM